LVVGSKCRRYIFLCFHLLWGKKIKIQEEKIHKPHFFLDTCTKLQYKEINLIFSWMSMAMKQSVLTKRQAEILSFIRTHIQYSGFPPTISEIQGQFSFKSPNAVQEHIKALVRKGQIRRNPNQWRGLELMVSNKSRNETAQYSTVSVPLMGRVTAGLPVLAEENYEGTVSVDRSLVGRATRLFALHVRGDSMIKAGIYDGDIAIAQQQSAADHGDVVIALLGDEATVKRFCLKKKTIVLQPENDMMQPIKISDGSDFKILGKVIATLHRVGNERAA
jgi:repressor LexA